MIDTNPRPKEISELMKIVDEALEALENSEIDLKSASGWGIVDLFGGGLITSLIKHNDMDDAQIHMHQAKDALSKLSDQLKTVSNDFDFHFDVMDFTDTLDIFIDNIFSDLQFSRQKAHDFSRREYQLYKALFLKQEIKFRKQLKVLKF